jgi:hypothetical protein
LEPLFATIAAEHAVNRADIDSVRDSLSHRGLNLTTNIPIALVYLGISALLLLLIRRRFSPQEVIVQASLVYTTADDGRVCRTTTPSSARDGFNQVRSR